MSRKYRHRLPFSTLAEAQAANFVLFEGERWTEKDPVTGRSTGRQKVGDGVETPPGSGIAVGTAFNDLPFEPTSAVNPFVFTQASPSLSWTINHNLGYRPSVELFDTGSQEFDAAVSHPTVNQTVVNMSVATSGFARLL